VGSKGIRPRKQRRPLPKLPDSVGDEHDLIPPVMWSPPGSGFEASPYSPAGGLQRLWWGARNVSRRERSNSRFSVVGVLVCVFLILAAVVGLLVSLLS
jgi:hypothetical protein